ncbi:UNVERIFIED_CONTAM: Retrovirus-related Pol polyprotein from transposon RE1 [Sesamum latifolium]|uniref:Retrovirus-related Pol polyprotein from transposon RE1 n=1 Tax=Sesamum latifolium TaxID=2727402 RepID=A0AAW2XVC9_9LAMI
MADEIQALENNNTWSLTPLPEGKQVLGSKWVYKLKLGPDGSVSRYKARLVAKGYTQVEGVDYTESFSPIAKSITVATDGFLALLVYVDDILIMGPNEDLIVAVKQHLDILFTIKDLGYVKCFLGLEMSRSSARMNVSEQKYVTDIITDTGLTDAKPVLTPLPQGIKLSTEIGALLTDPERYRRLIGHLLYLGFTRPDVSFVVQQLSQVLHHPTDQHWAAALHVVLYLKGTASAGLFFPASPSFQLMAYADADWGLVVIRVARSLVTVFFLALPHFLENQEAKHCFLFLS